jgi:hypothetical protein
VLQGGHKHPRNKNAGSAYADRPLSSPAARRRHRLQLLSQAGSFQPPCCVTDGRHFHPGVLASIHVSRDDSFWDVVRDFDGSFYTAAEGVHSNQ